MNPYKVGQTVQYMHRDHTVIGIQWNDIVVILDACDSAAEPRTVTVKDLAHFNPPPSASAAADPS